MAHILYRYLHEAQHPTTGLLESFPRSQDPELHGIAFTYDLALSCLVFTHHRSLGEAGRIAEFFRSMPLPTLHGQDYNTAYHVRHGLPALESTVHLGPMAWAALALARYARASGQLVYLRRAEELLLWAAGHLPHQAGGVAMGLVAPWTDRWSMENNWAYYAALRTVAALLPPARPDDHDGRAGGPSREALLQERRSVQNWLTRHEGQRGAGDPVKALDVYTNALLVGPAAHLEDFQAGQEDAIADWAMRMIDELEELFHVPGSFGYDYTDALEAGRAGRPRVNWLEGTEQVVVAYQQWAPFLEACGRPIFARKLLRWAGLAHAGVMRNSLVVANAVAIPNTDADEPVRTFADGWIARPWTEPATNSTTWAYFAEAGANPFNVAPELEGAAAIS